MSTNTQSRMTLFDGAGEHDKRVTPELLDILGLPYTYNDSEFIPLTERELGFMHIGEGFQLGTPPGESSAAFCRIPRMILDNGMKILNLSDDDYITPIESDRQEDLDRNYRVGRVIYKEIAESFGVEIVEEETSPFNRRSSYFLDVYIPLHVFDFIGTAEELRSYFAQRKYLSCPHAKAFKLKNQPVEIREAL